MIISFNVSRRIQNKKIMNSTRLQLGKRSLFTRATRDANIQFNTQSRNLIQSSCTLYVCFTVTAHVKGAKINGKRQHHFWSSFNSLNWAKTAHKTYKNGSLIALRETKLFHWNQYYVVLSAVLKSMHKAQ